MPWAPRVVAPGRGVAGRRCAVRRFAEPRPVARLSPVVAADLRDRVAVDVRVAMMGRLPVKHSRTTRHTPCPLITRSAPPGHPGRQSRHGTLAGSTFHANHPRCRPAARAARGISGQRTAQDFDDDRDDHRPAAVGLAHPAADVRRTSAGAGGCRRRRPRRPSRARPRSAGRTSSKTLSSSAKPRAWISGPPATLPVTESTTTTTEMKPSSPRIRRSFSDASATSPTLDPST